ncbi:MarR family winged helix-turn-helix transcriptional regulator [Larsenimonas salina]|uniref:MarR family winged helix-turn-helix transcriptional regulator n=1 Tax=Larsenimonas salina TaxID=1295565 RepID=UPI0020740049|nr:MarR family transcriptional regulator [Larsenimonas salina]MCM5704405.1 MarR family transcriptional regulator [Larsenimonas salina]
MTDTFDQCTADDRPADGPPPTRVAYLIGRLDRALRRHISEAVQPLGVTMQQYTALSVLARRSPLSNAKLAEKSLVSPQAANEMVKSMESKGLVERRPDPNHGRLIQISMTDKGQRVLGACDSAVIALEECMLEDMSTDQRTAFQRQLKASLKALGAGLIEPE